MRARLAVALLLAAASASPASGAAQRLVYLYANANEDEASGGHTALRLGSDVYHFQYGDGLLALERDDWRDFQLDYRGLQNRTLRAFRIDVGADTSDRIRAKFSERHLSRARQIELLHDLAADEALVAALTNAAADGAVDLPGLGFFSTGASPSPRLAALAAAIEAGPGFVAWERRKAALREELRALAADPLRISGREFEPEAFPGPHYPFHRRYADLVAGVRALEVLEAPGPLRSDALVSAGGEDVARPALEPLERERLREAADALVGRLAILSRGTRPDWGRALLLGMARLAAMEASLQRGHWVLLDAFGPDAESLPVTGRRRALLPELEAEARRAWERSRERFVATPVFDERALSALEETASRWWELRRAIWGAERIRIADWPRLPAGVGSLARPPVPDSLAREGAVRLAAMERAGRRARREARAHLGYRLATRNCVSEIFALIDEALADALRERGIDPDAAAVAEESKRRLGGHVRPSFGLGMIPFVSARRVRDRWRVTGIRELPSLRRAQLAALRTRDPSPWIPLRESNTFTSTLYAPGDEDSFFVFFTEGPAALRPLLGAVNFAAAVGAAGVGLLKLPFDGGRALESAARGALFSLPELGFQNIRKGSNDWIAPEQRPTDP